MFGDHFYHERVRKSVAAFGTLFNNLYVVRTDSNNQVLSQVKVPLSYAPKRKFLDRLRENPDLDTDTKVAIKLPRMSFEISSIVYNNAKQLQRTNQFSQPTTDGSGSQRARFYTSVPYNINFQLNIYAKTQDDALQLVEQILPYFNPQYNLTLKPFGDYSNIKEDIPTTITGVTFTDNFEGQLEERRTIIYSLDFAMAVNFYGPTTNVGVITQADISYFNMDAGLEDSDIRLQTTTLTPTPIITQDSDFTVTETVDFAYDDSA